VNAYITLHHPFLFSIITLDVNSSDIHLSLILSYSSLCQMLSPHGTRFPVEFAICLCWGLTHVLDVSGAHQSCSCSPVLGFMRRIQRAKHRTGFSRSTPLPIILIPTRKDRDYLASNLEIFVVPLDSITISHFSLLTCTTLCFLGPSFSALAPPCYSYTTYISNIFVPPMQMGHVFLALFIEKPSNRWSGSFGRRPGSAGSFVVPACPKG